MEFTEFADKIVDCISEYLLQYDIEKVQTEKVLKNNGILCTGLIICVKGEDISPNIYLDYYYAMYRQGCDFEEICKKISSEYISAKGAIDKKIQIDFGYENVKDKLFLKLVNYEKNKELLENSPFIPVLDMAVTFRYLVKKDDEGIASATVNNSDFAGWGITKDELYKIAKENTKKLFPVVLKRLDEILCDNMQNCDSLYNNLDIYILTNIQGINGATYMIYEDIISEFAEKINSNLFILPSSIHEVLLLPADNDCDKEHLSEMVQEINRFVVSDFDYLSDRAYFYDRNDGSIRI